MSWLFERERLWWGCRLWQGEVRGRLLFVVCARFRRGERDEDEVDNTGVNGFGGDYNVAAIYQERRRCSVFFFFFFFFFDRAPHGLNYSPCIAHMHIINTGICS